MRSEDLRVARELPAGAADVSGEQALGTVEVAVADRRHDEAVLVVHRSARALVHEGGVDAPVGLRAVPEPVTRSVSTTVSAARVGGEVEVAVEGEELLGIVDRAICSARAARRSRSVVQTWGAHPQQQGLDALADPVDLLALGRLSDEPGRRCWRRA